MLGAVSAHRDFEGSAMILATQSGSHAPLFYAQAAQLKLKESALPAEQFSAIREENARRLQRTT